jgi:hypothetical protein
VSWETRPYRAAEDLGSVAQFLVPLGDDSFRSRLRGRVQAYYRWKYGDDAGGSNRVRVAVDADGLVGVVAMLPRRVRIHGRVVTAFEMGDISTGEGHRRQGVFSRLGRELCDAAAATAAFTYVKPNEESSPVLLRHLGFTPLADVQTLARPLRVSRLLGHRLGRPLPRAVSLPLDGLFAIRPPRGAIGVGPEQAFGDEFDELWDAVAGDYPNIVVRDRAYLTWRYIDNPTPYVVLGARDMRGRLRGYAVALVVESGGRRIGYLVDILAGARDRATQQALGQGVLHACSDEGAVVVHTWLVKATRSVQSLLRASLRSLGFLPRGVSRVLWRPADAGLPADARAWYLTMADFDGI